MNKLQLLTIAGTLLATSAMASPVASHVRPQPSRTPAVITVKRASPVMKHVRKIRKATRKSGLKHLRKTSRQG